MLRYIKDMRRVEKGASAVTDGGQGRVVMVPTFEVASCITLDIREMTAYRAKRQGCMVVYEEADEQGNKTRAGMRPKGL